MRKAWKVPGIIQFSLWKSWKRQPSLWKIRSKHQNPTVFWQRYRNWSFTIGRTYCSTHSMLTWREAFLFVIWRCRWAKIFEKPIKKIVSSIRPVKELSSRQFGFRAGRGCGCRLPSWGTQHWLRQLALFVRFHVKNALDSVRLRIVRDYLRRSKARGRCRLCASRFDRRVGSKVKNLKSLGLSDPPYSYH